MDDTPTPATQPNPRIITPGHADILQAASNAQLQAKINALRTQIKQLNRLRDTAGIQALQAKIAQLMANTKAGIAFWLCMSAGALSLIALILSYQGSMSAPQSAIGYAAAYQAAGPAHEVQP